MRLRDLELRTELLDALPLPVKVLGGALGEVRGERNAVAQPLATQPMLITIDRVLLLLAPKTAEDVAAEEAEGESKQAQAEAVEAVENLTEARQEMGLQPDRSHCALAAPAASGGSDECARARGGRCDMMRPWHHAPQLAC